VLSPGGRQPSLVEPVSAAQWLAPVEILQPRKKKFRTVIIVRNCLQHLPGFPHNKEKYIAMVVYSRAGALNLVRAESAWSVPVGMGLVQ
jgi:hypothetical protein